MKGKKTKSIGALILSLIFALVVSIFPMMSALALEGDVEINETNFPDAIFREYVESFDTDETKGVLSQAERDEVTRISVKNKGISDLKGVEFFTNLTELICNENSLTNLDVSKNTKLSYLSCGYNSLTELDVSANTALNALYCNDNQLTGLDMSNNLNLQNLNCNFNKITNLDVTQNTALESLLCRVNELDSLDVSKNLALTDLDCGSNNLTNLNVTENTDLTTLSCYKNQLTELDVTQNTALTLLDCSHNILSTLDVTQNTDLKTLNCANTALSTLDVSQNPALERLECYSNQLTELDVRQNPALKSLRCMTNKLTVLDVSQNPALEKLECYNNQLTSLDVSANSNLDTFDARFQEYNIEVDPDILSFNLSSLPGNFNPERAHNLVGATVSGTTLIVDSTKPAKITYNYNAVDNDKTFDVTLNVTYIGTGTGKVTVSFDANGGTGTMESEIINKGSNYTLPENTFTAPAGQEFNYWEVNGTKKAVGDVITVNEATTVKAVWAEQVTVSFDANGGTGTMESEIINKGSNYTLPESTFTAPAGQEFYYWEVNGIEKAVGDVITVNEDTTVKAMWNNFVEINEINFPDANFRAYVESDIDRNNDGRLSTEERDRINIIIVSDKDISDLKGIEFFTKLEQLHCYNNKLTNIDISQNTALTILNCDNNQLTNLDVRQNTALTLLGCYNNQLTNLDVSQNTALTVLECQNNQLTNLDVSQNPDLKTLKCNNNQLTSLDVSANANLTTFDARLQKYNIEVDENTLTFDLSSLPGDFNLAR
ncbi:MAG: InlB B-repeat-containing protein, partial [Clostridia bacterium]|nr:InlB B-repeat-containing protein [Clostridia bacterium]